MNEHLGEISANVDPGAHAVILVDQAGWHTTPKLKMPSNITLLKLPPRAPELNPVENIWQFIRDNWLSNRVFQSYDDILALCCEAWNKLINQPWHIMKIGMRDWAYRHSLYRLVSDSHTAVFCRRLSCVMGFLHWWLSARPEMAQRSQRPRLILRGRDATPHQRTNGPSLSPHKKPWERH